MWMLVRQFCAIVALPGVVTIVVPFWIARRYGVSLTAPTTAWDVVMFLAGTTFLAVGAALFANSLYYFWTRGRGTLAPWDPPREFVVEGPYRYVRNPMISGVIFVLFGEALILRSRPHADWGGLFTIINFVYIPLLEEPMLAARFGETYRRYTRHVPRFLPRFSPWRPE